MKSENEIKAMLDSHIRHLAATPQTLTTNRIADMAVIDMLQWVLDLDDDPQGAKR